MQSKQANLTVPYLEVEVPALLDEKGRPHVPAVFFSRLLGLDHSLEMRRVQHIMLRYQMHYFLVQQPQLRCVWTFPYPLGLAMWLGTVDDRVKDRAWQMKLKRFIEWGMKLSGQAFEQTQHQFIQTRKDMYALAATIADIEQQMQHVRMMALLFPPVQQTHIHRLDGRWRHLSEQAGAFIQQWLADKNALPIIQAFVVKDGVVDPDSPSVSLLATASQADIDTLDWYAQAISHWAHELKALLDEFQS
jgi:hypothetical protein